jgi:hypothetical protein
LVADLKAFDDAQLLVRGNTGCAATRGWRDGVLRWTTPTQSRSRCISASQKANWRLSFERAYGDQTDKNLRRGLSDNAYRERHARTCNAARRSRRVETDVNRLCPRFDLRADPRQLVDGC